MDVDQDPLSASKRSMCVKDFAVIDDVPAKVQNDKNTSNFNFEVEMNKAANSKRNNFEGEQ